jgi:hypothetical protein
MPEIATSPIPAGVEQEFAGQWIAIRDGEVIASAQTFDGLVNDPRVHEGDVRYLVPSSPPVA